MRLLKNIAVLILLLMAGPAFAQTSNSRLYDSLGKGITSHLVSSDRGIDVYCIGGCGGGAVTGTVTVTQATGTNLHAVLDSGTLTGITNHVTVDAGINLNTSGLLTDTQLRATPVPVSGTVTANGPADSTVTGTMNATADTVVLPLSGYQGAGFIITGTWTGAISFQSSYDGGSTYGIAKVIAPDGTVFSGISANISGGFLQTGGMTHVRVYFTRTSGSASASLTATQGIAGQISALAAAGGATPSTLNMIGGVWSEANLSYYPAIRSGNATSSDIAFVTKPVNTSSNPLYVTGTSLDTMSTTLSTISTTLSTISTTLSSANLYQDKLVDAADEAMISREEMDEERMAMEE